MPSVDHFPTISKAWTPSSHVQVYIILEHFEVYHRKAMPARHPKKRGFDVMWDVLLASHAV